MGNVYHILYTYNPISLDTTKILSKLGILVPYDSLNPDINCYVYVSKEQVENTKLLKQVKSIIGDFQILPSTTTLKEINKNIDKIDDTNKLLLGDLVTHSLYRKLPFTVTYLGKDTAIIFHKLKHKDLALEVEQKEISKLIEQPLPQLYISQEKPKVTYNLDKLLVIDCDIFSNNSTYNIINLIVLTKLLFQDKTIVVCNPDHNQKSMCEAFKLIYASGDIIDILYDITSWENSAPPVYIISNSNLLEYLLYTHQNIEYYRLYKYKDILIEQKYKQDKETETKLLLQATKEMFGKTLDTNYILHKSKTIPIESIEPKVNKLLKIISKVKYQEPKITIPQETIIQNSEVEKTMRNCGAWHLAQLSQSVIDILTRNA